MPTTVATSPTMTTTTAPTTTVGGVTTSTMTDVTCTFSAGNGAGDIRGTLILRQQSAVQLTIFGQLKSATLNEGERGIHVHTYGVLDANCTGAGPHYNPYEKNNIIF